MSRYFTAAKSKNLPILEFDHKKVLESLGLTNEEVITQVKWSSLICAFFWDVTIVTQ